MSIKLINFKNICDIEFDTVENCIDFIRLYAHYEREDKLNDIDLYKRIIIKQQEETIKKMCEDADFEEEDEEKEEELKPIT